MHFRDRGNSVQVLRITYEEESKRPKQTVLGRIPKKTMEPEEDLLKAATPEEQEEIRAWIERNSRILAAKAQATAYSLPEVVRSVVRYFETATNEAEREALHGMMLEASKRLRRAARSAEEGTDAEGEGRGEGERRGRRRRRAEDAEAA